MGKQSVVFAGYLASRKMAFRRRSIDLCRDIALSPSLRPFVAFGVVLTGAVDLVLQ